MMAAARHSLLQRLPKVAGDYTENAALAPAAWFRVGGPAEILYRPADTEDLALFLAAKPSDIPVTLFGSGSNILVRDGGIPGVVIRLGSAFRECRAEWREDSALVHVGAGAIDISVARFCRDAGVADFATHEQPGFTPGAGDLVFSEWLVDPVNADEDYGFDVAGFIHVPQVLSATDTGR